MNVLGIIPARSGSKGVKNKNIRPIKGKPLLEYSVFTALEAKKKIFYLILSCQQILENILNY